MQQLISVHIYISDPRTLQYKNKYEFLRIRDDILIIYDLVRVDTSRNHRTNKGPIQARDHRINLNPNQNRDAYPSNLIRMRQCLIGSLIPSGESENHSIPPIGPQILHIRIRDLSITYQMPYKTYSINKSISL